mmetsp:Transcript_22952/g.58323  ORF Transcript_22952/g.58323 Transcript_22952/m.58323 type:complete len:87 (+) Transcript_22952:348-608(+)
MAAAMGGRGGGSSLGSLGLGASAQGPAPLPGTLAAREAAVVGGGRSSAPGSVHGERPAPHAQLAPHTARMLGAGTGLPSRVPSSLQ